MYEKHAVKSIKTASKAGSERKQPRKQWNKGKSGNQENSTKRKKTDQVWKPYGRITGFERKKRRKKKKEEK